MEGVPSIHITQVFGEAIIELSVQGDKSFLETMPETIGCGFRDGIVHPSWRNAMIGFVVENYLEWGEYLEGNMSRGDVRRSLKRALLHRRHPCQRE